jgi:hypothetical protein
VCIFSWFTLLRFLEIVFDYEVSSSNRRRDWSGLNIHDWTFITVFKVLVRIQSP